MTEQRVDLVKLREWEEPDPEVHRRESWDPESWAWPAPPTKVESRIEGRLRAEVLVRLGRPTDDPAELRLVEISAEGGFSEFTVETDFELELWIHEGQQAQLVWSADWIHAASSESVLSAFIRWVTGEGPPRPSATPAPIVQLGPMPISSGALQRAIARAADQRFIGDHVRWERG